VIKLNCWTSLALCSVSFALDLWVKLVEITCQNQSGTEWIRVDKSETEWIRADQSGSEWIKVNQSGSKWIRVDQSESEWIRVDPSGSVCWALWLEDERRLLVAEMAMLRRIRGKSRRERIRNKKTWEELGAEETVVEKIKGRRLTWFRQWTRGKDGRKKTTKCSTAWACERRKKKRKAKEEMDGQC